MVMFAGYDARYQSAPPNGYQETYYDPASGQLMVRNPNYVAWSPATAPQFIPLGQGAKEGLFGRNPGATANTPPSVDFNKLPSQVPAGVQIYGAGQAAQPYQRPAQPTTPTGARYRPQFDPSFIQQMLAQRFGNNQGSGIPTAARPTLTPGATQSYGGYQGQGGLGALRAIANPTPAAPSGGNQNAPV